jgi:hypothetical protein
VTFNHGVEGSSPSALTKFSPKIKLLCAFVREVNLAPYCVHTLCTPTLQIFAKLVGAFLYVFPNYRRDAIRCFGVLSDLPWKALYCVGISSLSYRGRSQ